MGYCSANRLRKLPGESLAAHPAAYAAGSPTLTPGASPPRGEGRKTPGSPEQRRNENGREEIAFLTAGVAKHFNCGLLHRFADRFVLHRTQLAAVQRKVAIVDFQRQEVE